ncbi:MAG: hypothetical protein OHK0029_19220 [Armatimonadaceae bacterium]
MAADTENRCAKCGRDNPEGMRFCGFCGSPLAAAYQNPPANPATPTTPEAGNEEAPTLAPNRAPRTASGAPSDLERTIDIRAAMNSAPPAPAAAPAQEFAPTPEAPPSPRPARPKPEIAVPADPIAREVERDRLMTQAGVFRARGQVTDARETLEKALVLSEGGKPRDIAAIQEQIGDLLMIEEDLEGAKDAYAEAFKTDPSRATAEKKYGTTQIAISDREAEKRLGQRILQDDSLADIISSGGLTGHSGKRNAGLAMFLSVIVPGFGQIYNGQMAKGFILLGVFVTALLIISLSPDKDALYKTIAATFALKPTRGEPVPAMLWGVALVGFITWLYAIVDAPFYAKQHDDDTVVSPLSAEDKSGWEV